MDDFLRIAVVDTSPKKQARDNLGLVGDKEETSATGYKCRLAALSASSLEFSAPAPIESLYFALFVGFERRSGHSCRDSLGHHYHSWLKYW